MRIMSEPVPQTPSAGTVATGPVTMTRSRMPSTLTVFPEMSVNVSVVVELSATKIMLS